MGVSGGLEAQGNGDAAFGGRGGGGLVDDDGARFMDGGARWADGGRARVVARWCGAVGGPGDGYLKNVAALASVFDAVDVGAAALSVEFYEDVVFAVQACVADDECAGAVVEALGGQGFCVATAVIAGGVDFKGRSDVVALDFPPVIFLDGVMHGQTVAVLLHVDGVEFDVDFLGVGIGSETKRGDGKRGKQQDGQAGEDVGFFEDVGRNHGVLH